MIIYLALNKINGKKYVGQTSQTINRRIASHLCAKSGAFPLALKKYGLQSFDFSILDLATNKKELNEKEAYWIKLHNCKSPNGYNLTDGGDGIIGFSFSLESKKKISTTQQGNTYCKGRVLSEETKKKISKARMGQKHVHTTEARKKLSEALSGRKLSEETKERISESLKLWHKQKQEGIPAELN